MIDEPRPGSNLDAEPLANENLKFLENIEETLPADQIYEMIAYGDDDFDGKVLFIFKKLGVNIDLLKNLIDKI